MERLNQIVNHVFETNGYADALFTEWMNAYNNEETLFEYGLASRLNVTEDGYKALLGLAKKLNVNLRSTYEEERELMGDNVEWFSFIPYESYVKPAHYGLYFSALIAICFSIEINDSEESKALLQEIINL